MKPAQLRDEVLFCVSIFRGQSAFPSGLLDRHRHQVDMVHEVDVQEERYFLFGEIRALLQRNGGKATARWRGRRPR